MTLLRRQLVVLQQSPFCNIDCTYCYLPHRNISKHMSFSTLEKIYEEVFKSNAMHDPITFLWHAGEPLAVGRAFFEDAFKLCEEINKKYGREYTQNIQTNATLIDEQWIELFRCNKVILGISLDGPEFIHNRQRVTRSGKGTHAQVMRGVELLQKGGINFEVITVLTSFSLDYPDEMFDFFVKKGIKGVGFNIDEIEGIHNVSSYQSEDAEVKYRHFMHRFLELTLQQPGVLSIREFRSRIPVIIYPNIKIGDGEGFNNTNVPLQILTINYKGDYSTFCPELSGATSVEYDNFIMGNIFTNPIDSIFEHPIFQKVNEEVQKGVQECKTNCDYWSLCGGGSPANKFFETGKLSATETMQCRIHVKGLTNTILEFFEERLS